MKLPTLKDLTALVANVKEQIEDDCLAFDESDEPSIQLTVGANEAGEWDYQTGDNSYSGGAYFYPHWAVVGVYRDSNVREVAKDIQNQIADLLAS